MISLKEYKSQDPKSIQSLFASIAKQYDSTNGALSFFLHKYWNARLVKHTFKNKARGNYLDLCCGTGAIAWNFLKRQKKSQQLVLSDFCQEMLDEGKRQAHKKGFFNKHKLSFVKADAQHLPFDDHQFDFITLAYGIRNIPDPQQALKECFRVLKPTGRIGILELTRPPHPFMRFFHTQYLRYLLPIMGRLLTRNQAAYEYLSTSIEAFISPTHLKHLLLELGFTKAKSIPLSLGITHVILAEKPISS